jgi:protein-tyrosine phosphatase
MAASALEIEKGFRFRPTKRVAAAARSLLPEAVIHELQQYRAYSTEQRALFLKMRLSNRLGLMKPGLASLPNAVRAVLFVCYGNIMRSPMCEALLNKEFASCRDRQFTVKSAGLNAVPGRPAHPWAITAAQDFGISLENHHAQSLTQEMVSAADAIFVMDYHNQVQLLSRWADVSKKVFLVGLCAGRSGRPVEISDPYYAGLEGTRNCYRVLSACIQNLARGLLSQERTLAE